MPDTIDSADIAEATWANAALTELVWPPMFFGSWAAFEPDVLFQEFKLLAYYSLSMGKRTSQSYV